MPAETTAGILSMISGGILEKFPKLKVGLAHGGTKNCSRIYHNCITGNDFIKIYASEITVFHTISKTYMSLNYRLFTAVHNFLLKEQMPVSKCVSIGK